MGVGRWGQGKKDGLAMKADALFSHALVPGPDTVLIGRVEAAGAVLEALTDRGSVGAVVVAPSGYGKTLLARQVVEQLGGRVLVVQLRGTVYAGSRSYGALTYLLAELDDAQLAHPMLVLDGLSQQLTRAAGGRDIVLLIDNAEHIDGDSATLLGQLVTRGDVRGIILARDFSAVPPAFLSLGHDPRMRRIDLPPLNQAEVGELAAAGLDGRLSREAARVLRTHSGGNPRLEPLLVRDYVSSGALRERNGVWVHTGKPVRLGPPTVSTVCATLSGLNDDVLDLARQLAESGGLPLSDLQAAGRGAALDQLQYRGIAGIGYRPAPVVKIADRLMAEALRATSPDGHYRSRPPAVPRTALRSHPEPVRNGLVPPLDTARSMVFQGEDAGSLDLLRRCAEDPFVPTWQRLLSRALLCESLAVTGRSDDALAVADEPWPDLATVPEERRREIQQHRAAAYLLSGSWLDGAGRLRQCGRRGDPGGTWEELVDGIVLALTGDLHRAAGLLRSARAQSSEADPDGLAPLAEAASAYCRAMLNEAGGEARTEPPRGGASPWLINRLERHFRALARAAGGDVDGALRLLRQQAAADRSAAVGTMEMMALAAMARLSGVAEDGRLLELATRYQGPFADVCETYAKGLASANASLLLQAAEQAARAGQLTFARDVAGQAEAAADRSGRADVLRRVRRKVRTLLEAGTESGYEAAWRGRLTAREQAVARFVAEGRSNHAVARELGVSTRTVEGHLYQVFSKLLIRSRQELAEMLAPESPGPTA